MSSEIFSDDFDADFHRGVPGFVDGGFADEDVAMMGGVDEADRIDAESDANFAGMALWRRSRLDCR